MNFAGRDKTRFCYLKFRGSSNQRIIHLKDGVPERIE